MGNRKSSGGVKKKHNFFFEHSSEPLFIADISGNIGDLNHKGVELLSSNNRALLNFFFLFHNQHEKDTFWKQLSKKKILIDFKTKFITSKKEIIDVLISAKIITDKNSETTGFEGMIKPSGKIRNQMAKAIIDTQEKERKRFADDLHDNFSQQLSAIKFHISTLQNVNLPPNYKRILFNSDEIINNLLMEIRSICFNLVPTSLQSYGLKHAVSELCRKTQSNGKLDFFVKIDPNFPVMEKATEVNIFRVIQEFIHNSIKHGNAKNISIKMKYSAKTKEVIFLLEDDGKGFEIKDHMKDKNNGMGLKNIQTRVELCNGDITMKSFVNKGTKFKITIPYQNQNENKSGKTTTTDRGRS
jgi:signal transduction histidine kinase